MNPKAVAFTRKAVVTSLKAVVINGEGDS